MSRAPIPSKPPFLERITTGTVTEQAAQDQKPLLLEERVWCWFCYRGHFAAWKEDGFWTFRCVGPASCHAYYVAWDAESYIQLPSESLVTRRFRCYCGAMYFKIKSTAFKCIKCGKEQEIKASLKGVAALLEPVVREQQRGSGFLADTGGPTFHLAGNPDPWKPRVDMPSQVLRRRLALYRRKELAKIDGGRDPAKDYRRFKDVW